MRFLLLWLLCGVAGNAVYMVLTSYLYFRPWHERGASRARIIQSALYVSWPNRQMVPAYVTATLLGPLGWLYLRAAKRRR